jgi:hypothetical protein
LNCGLLLINLPFKIGLYRAFWGKKRVFYLARAKRHYIPGQIWHILNETEKSRDEEWTRSIAVGSQPFVENVKDQLGVKAKGRESNRGDQGVSASGGSRPL